MSEQIIIPVAGVDAERNILVKANDVQEAICKQKHLDSEVISKLQARINDLEGAILSVNKSDEHIVNVDGDDEPCYWQRKEWVDWIVSLAKGEDYEQQ